MPKEKSDKKADKTDKTSDTDSIDSKGNIRNLVDYDYTSDESDTLLHNLKLSIPRKAAIAANDKIKRISRKLIQNEKSEQPKKKTIKQITPVKRKFPFKKGDSRHKSTSHSCARYPRSASLKTSPQRAPVTTHPE